MTKQLDEHVTQFRATQKRLLILFKDKTPTTVKSLDVVLDTSYNEASACHSRVNCDCLGKNLLAFVQYSVYMCLFELQACINICEICD